MNLFQRIEWRLYKEIKRLRLKNRHPTIISSNCNGEFIYYDMRLQFRSPTINLSFDMNDYVKFLENLRWYMEQPITPFSDKRFDYPCGMLGDIEIRFNHYQTFEEAVAKWEERKRRIDWGIFLFLALTVITVPMKACGVLMSFRTKTRWFSLMFQDPKSNRHSIFRDLKMSPE